MKKELQKFMQQKSDILKINGILLKSLIGNRPGSHKHIYAQLIDDTNGHTH
jgi:hypothetical protein